MGLELERIGLAEDASQRRWYDLPAIAGGGVGQKPDDEQLAFAELYLAAIIRGRDHDLLGRRPLGSAQLEGA